MEKSFVNFNPIKLFIKLAELVAHQQGMGVARITVNKITTPTTGK